VQVHRGRGVRGQDPAPEEDGAFKRAPERDHREEERRRTAPDLRDVGDAEVMRHERVDHRQVREGQEAEVHISHHLRAAHELRTTAPEADRNGDDPVDRKGERYGKGSEPQRRDHDSASRTSERYRSWGAWPSGGGRYSFECLTITFVDSNTPERIRRPSTTTAIPSRNIFGGPPLESN